MQATCLEGATHYPGLQTFIIDPASTRDDRQYEVDYEGLWAASSGVDDFGDRASTAWASEYLSSVQADPDDLVVVDPGNGFHYLYDLAGSLTGESLAQAPRVVGVWGRSQPGGHRRDVSRMRGFPRPSHDGDDRGHLIACAAGGGYDINLLPMNAALNRGWSADGARFRAMERRAVASPGTLFFIRPIYDDTDRSARFEVGVQTGDTLLLDTFENPRVAATPMRLAVLRQSAAFPIDPTVVSGCLDPASPADSLFARGWKAGPASLSRAERCAIAGVTGHVAESVAELVLDALEWRVLWHFTGAGRHGVDLVFLTPDGNVVAVEVKGTLVAGRIPRLSRRELAQMSAAWVDKADNPGMAELGLASDDVYGAVVAVNFSDLTWRAAMTADFVDLRHVEQVEQLTDLGWLTAR